MMKEEIIIDEQYNIAVEKDISDTYLNVYNVNPSDKSYDSKIRVVFAFYHEELNRLLSSLNNRINGSKYYTANEGRQLLKYIENIFTIQKAYFETKYDFIIDRNYYLYFKNLQSILEEYGTHLPDELKVIILKKYEPMFTLKNSSIEFINSEDNIDEVLSLVSTRNARFDEMADDEKLGNLNIAIEHMLKNGKKYIDFDYNDTFLGFITKDNITGFRNATHCFRHAAENIEKRRGYTNIQKKFLANYGLTICMAILNKRKNCKK